MVRSNIVIPNHHVIKEPQTMACRQDIEWPVKVKINIDFYQQNWSYSFLNIQILSMNLTIVPSEDE
jgi:hypothetical protein